MEIEHKSIPFELKEVSESGSFTGYGSVFGNEDSYGDIVVKGAFAQTLGTKSVPVLWQHNPNEPIGVYTEMKEDDKGLFVKGDLALSTQKGKEAYELLKMGVISGLSIGYSVSKFEEDTKSDIRKLTELDLWEVSLVTFPANVKARITNVKDLVSGGMPTEREFERLLRDLGLTKSQSKIVIAQGFRALQRDADQDSKQVIDSLKGLIGNLKHGNGN